MTALVFVDTNVLLYACDAAEPAKQRLAAQWIERLWGERAGRLSVQVLSEFYVNVTRKLKPGMSSDAAWEVLESYLPWEPLAIDATVLNHARDIERRFGLNWWDSTVVAAAQVQGCEILLTEDLQHGMHMGGLVVRNPFKVQAEEALAEYASTPRPRALHRPPGRPARARSAAA